MTPMRLLDGRRVARAIQDELARRVGTLRLRGVTPAWGVLLVGMNPASVVYIRNKERLATALGIRTVVERLPTSAPVAAVEQTIDRWNADPQLHGVIVQLPLPVPLAPSDVVARIDPQKDLDCLHPENVGLLAFGTPRFLPPTPAGIQQLLLRSGVPIEGQHVVILGRSSLVGKPLALMLGGKAAGANATVTVCHSATRGLPAITRQADILVVAVNRPKFLTGEHLKPGAVIVDVGMHQTAEGWVGDVDHAAVQNIASALSPVPGGVGPMTVAMLMANIVQAAERQESVIARRSPKATDEAIPSRKKVPTRIASWSLPSSSGEGRAMTM